MSSELIPALFAKGALKGALGHWGYLALFTLVVAGNVGVPLPESTVLWVAGYLSFKGTLSLSVVLAVGIIAAVAGDNLGYAIGRRFGHALFLRYAAWAGLTPARLERLREFVQRYGALGVFLARFLTGLRFLAGPLAGSLGLPWPAFLLANVLGAICYVPVMVGAGYAVGYGWGRYVKPLSRGVTWVETLLLLAAAVIGLGWLGGYLLHQRRRRMAR